MKKLLFDKLSPVQTLALGFFALILTGAIILCLPVSSQNGTWLHFTDALFTSASAVSTTGLTTIDTGSYYNLFGQFIVILLIQIGGLGYMVFIVIFLTSANKKISILGRKFMRESISRTQEIDIFKFTRVIIYSTILIELIGTILYFAVFINDMPFWDAARQAVFHSISAFCTAGFSLFSNNLCNYRDNWLININTNFLAITGALGFLVLYDIYKYFKFKFLMKQEQAFKFSFHSKIVMYASSIIFITGSLVIFLAEGNKYSDNFLSNILIAVFQAVSGSTTVGFNTVDLSIMSEISYMILIVLMFIGGSPGSTAGGIKTSSAFVISIFTFRIFQNQRDITIFKRRLNNDVIGNIIALSVFGALLVFVATLILGFTEPRIDIVKLLFEASSGFGTVGLSTGITPVLSEAGKIIIILLMYIGRVGTLGFGFSLLGKVKPKEFTYPEEEILI